MTNQWYFRVGEEELGPVSFRELVELARVGVINEGDRVRSFWKDSPQRADSVAGLFYMSRQARIVQPEVVELSPAVIDQLAAVEESDNPTAPVRPEWLQRLLELQSSVQSIRGAGRASTNADESESFNAENLQVTECSSPAEELESQPDWDEQPSTNEFVATSGQSGDTAVWAMTMEAALTQVDSRGAGRAVPRRSVWGTCGAIAKTVSDAVRSREFLSFTFRAACLIGVASVVGMWVDQWSIREQMRFPTGSGQHSEETRMFPLVGKCGSTEYLLLLTNAMLVCGAGAYGIAAFLESRAED